MRTSPSFGGSRSSSTTSQSFPSSQRTAAFVFIPYLLLRPVRARSSHRRHAAAPAPNAGGEGSAAEEVPDLAGDLEVLAGLDDEDGDALPCRADHPVVCGPGAGRGRGVGLVVEAEAEEPETAAGPGPHLGRVLADPAGEDEGVEPAE